MESTGQHRCIATSVQPSLHANSKWYFEFQMKLKTSRLEPSGLLKKCDRLWSTLAWVSKLIMTDFTVSHFSCFKSHFHYLNRLSWFLIFWQTFSSLRPLAYFPRLFDWSSEGTKPSKIVSETKSHLASPLAMERLVLRLGMNLLVTKNVHIHQCNRAWIGEHEKLTTEKEHSSIIHVNSFRKKPHLLSHWRQKLNLGHQMCFLLCFKRPLKWQLRS